MGKIFFTLYFLYLSISASALPSKQDIFKPTNKEQTALIFDLPMTYNADVSRWIRHYQTAGQTYFKTWLSRAQIHVPKIQKIFKEEGLPLDLAYMAMIESGFSAHATSTAQAVGPWQFIEETGRRYGLKINWWIDERKDFEKSTRAAAKYLKFLKQNLHVWYLVAAGYNAGENSILRKIKKHQTTNFWRLAERDLHDETKNYVPKLIAAILISKAPKLYGFKEIPKESELPVETTSVPGGTSLSDISDLIGVQPKMVRDLNPELLRGLVPTHISRHTVSVPLGSADVLQAYFKKLHRFNSSL